MSFIDHINELVEARFTVHLTVEALSEQWDPFSLREFLNPAMFKCPQCGSQGLTYWYRHMQVNCTGCSFWAMIIGTTKDGRVIVAYPTGGL